MDTRESTSEGDRGVDTVDTVGHTQDGVLGCTFRRAVTVPGQGYLDARRRPARAARPAAPVA